MYICMFAYMYACVICKTLNERALNVVGVFDVEKTKTTKIATTKDTTTITNNTSRRFTSQRVMLIYSNSLTY